MVARKRLINMPLVLCGLRDEQTCCVPSGISCKRSLQSLSSRVNNLLPFVFRKGQVGDWKNYMTDQARRWVNEEAGQELLRQSYIDSLDW